jgi:excisionase family DNA binding protein
MAETFLTTDQVADRLHLDVRTVRRLIRTANLPGIYMGKSYRIPESELLRWMNEHRIGRRDIDYVF